VPRLTFLRLRDVPWTKYDLQCVWDHRKLGGLVPYDLPVDGEFQAPGGSLDGCYEGSSLTWKAADLGWYFPTITYSQGL
jgi:hypothetical protein